MLQIEADANGHSMRPSPSKAMYKKLMLKLCQHHKCPSEVAKQKLSVLTEVVQAPSMQRKIDVSRKTQNWCDEKWRLRDDHGKLYREGMRTWSGQK